MEPSSTSAVTGEQLTAMFEMLGWLRISLTANDAMIERALAVFAEAIAEVGVGAAA
jgi:hypothetical protein